MSYRVNEATLRSDTTLTGSYVYSDVQKGGKAKDQLSVLYNYTVGDEASVEIVVEFSDTYAFTDAYVATRTNAAVSGVETVRQLVYQLDGTSPAKGKIDVPVQGMYFRVGVKATGGTPDGTIALKSRCSMQQKGV